MQEVKVYGVQDRRSTAQAKLPWVVRYTIDGRVPETEGNHHPTARPMGTYRAADGHLNIAAPGERLWERLCEVLDDPGLRADERFATPRSRYHHRDELNDALDARIGARTRDEWIELLDAAGIPCGKVNAMDEVFADPQVQHLAVLATVDHATRGPVDVLRNPITMTRSAPVEPTASPMPGNDPGEVLDALGIPRPD